MSLLILGFTVVAAMLIIGGVDVTAVQLARTRMLDAADAAAVDASDSLDLQGAYSRGLDTSVTVSDASVRAAAAAYLAVQPRPHGISEWHLAPGTGSPDGHTSVVRLQGTAQLPMLAPVLRSWGGAVTITVESRARSELQ